MKLGHCSSWAFLCDFYLAWIFFNFQQSWGLIQHRKAASTNANPCLPTLLSQLMQEFYALFLLTNSTMDVDPLPPFRQCVKKAWISEQEVFPSLGPKGKGYCAKCRANFDNFGHDPSTHLLRQSNKMVLLAPKDISKSKIAYWWIKNIFSGAWDWLFEPSKAQSPFEGESDLQRTRTPPILLLAACSRNSES